MFAGGLVLSSTLLFFAGWLQWTEKRGWPHDHFDGEDDQEYLQRRMKSRGLVNTLIGTCGLLILLATLAGPRTLVFLAAWLTVTLILLVIVLLAGLDAYRTLRHQKDKLRRLRERALNE